MFHGAVSVLFSAGGEGMTRRSAEEWEWEGSSVQFEVCRHSPAQAWRWPAGALGGIAIDQVNALP